MNGLAVEHVPSFATAPEAALAAYRRLGVHVEPGVWTAAECHALLGAAATLPAAQSGRFAPEMNPHRLHPRFFEALRDPRVVRIMERLLAGRVSGLQSEFFYTPPGTPGFAAHQDNYYVEAPPDAFASAWVPLTDTAAANGGLVVYPGSHLEPILPVAPCEEGGAPTAQDPNARRQRTLVPRAYPAVDLAVPRGAVVLLHGHLVHASHDNRSPAPRPALLLTYIRRGERFRPGTRARRAEVAVGS